MSETPPDGSALRKSLADLVNESQALRTDVHAAEQARRRAGHVNLALLAVLGVLIVSLLVVGWQNNRLAHRVNETNARMADCTTPGGACYRQGSDRTGEAIAAVLRAEVAAVECARLWPGESGPALDRKLEACVYERLAKYSATPSPTPSPSPAPAR